MTLRVVVGLEREEAYIALKRTFFVANMPLHVLLQLFLSRQANAAEITLESVIVSHRMSLRVLDFSLALEAELFNVRNVYFVNRQHVLGTDLLRPEYLATLEARKLVRTTSVGENAATLSRVVFDHAAASVELLVALPALVAAFARVARRFLASDVNFLVLLGQITGGEHFSAERTEKKVQISR